jgi:hypothetical protein
MGQHTKNAIETLEQIGDAIDRAIDVDFWLYVLIALFGALAGVLGSNDASTFIDVKPLFYYRSSCTITAAVLLSAKMYRSTKYGERKGRLAAPVEEPPKP